MKNIVVSNEFTKRQLIRFIESLDLTKPWKFEWKLYRAKRSNDANALYWKWLTLMAAFFSTDQRRFTKDDMHDLMRHTHLGYETKIIGNTELAPQLKSTAKLDVTEFCFYMQKIETWAAIHGCLLPRPEDNEYTEWWEHHEAANDS